MNRIVEAVEVDFLPRKANVAFSGPDAIGRSSTKERPRILIVDNDRDTTHLAKVLLERICDYLVFEEKDATKAHQSALNFRPDLILLDIVMAETDAGEIAARIEADPELKNIPIVFLTALVTRSEAKSGSQNPGTSISCEAGEHSRVGQCDR